TSSFRCSSLSSSSSTSSFRCSSLSSSTCCLSSSSSTCCLSSAPAPAPCCLSSSTAASAPAPCCLSSAPAPSTCCLSLRNGDHFWIGLFKDSWKWSDQSNSSFRYWKFMQPDNTYNTKCAAASVNDQGQWHDIGCEEPHPFICHEKQLVPLYNKCP
uniref:C-type lectin domain-containing protein n=1 Tax=Astyanax mexicanus TaxID=7994 RepID=A0A3B1KCD5_ASTMX